MNHTQEMCAKTGETAVTQDWLDSFWHGNWVNMGGSRESRMSRLCQFSIAPNEHGDWHAYVGREQFREYITRTWLEKFVALMLEESQGDD